MKMRLIARDSLPPRRSAKQSQQDAPEARYGDDGRRQRYTGYRDIVAQFRAGSDITAQVMSEIHPDTLYRGLLSACHDKGVTEIDVARRGDKIYLTRAADNDKIARAQRREAVRDTLLAFDSSGERTGVIECAPEAFASLYALYQKTRTTLGLGYVTVSRGAHDGSVRLTNNMIKMVRE